MKISNLGTFFRISRCIYYSSMYEGNSRELHPIFPGRTLMLHLLFTEINMAADKIKGNSLIS
jgi:hypothetical protein